MNRLILLVPALAACITRVPLTTSSATSLSSHDSTVELALSATAGARAVVRLLELRGYQLLDQHAVGRELQIKLGRERGINTQYDGTIVGSVIYVRITPQTDQSSSASLLAKPVFDRLEGCASVEPGCKPPAVWNTYARFLTGDYEAEVVHGVVSELELDGFAIAHAPAVSQAP